MISLGPGPLWTRRLEAVDGAQRPSPGSAFAGSRPTGLPQACQAALWAASSRARMCGSGST